MADAEIADEPGEGLMERFAAADQHVVMLGLKGRGASPHGLRAGAA